MIDHPPWKLIAPSASIDEAAAIVAALQRFEQDTAARPASVPRQADPWARSAILEGVSREEQDDLPDPWINT
jgi:hypothetical protein